MIVGIVGWIVVGLLVGFLVSKVLDLHGDDPMLGIGVAAGGAVVAALGYTFYSGAGITMFNPWSLVSAAVGAVVVLAVWHGVRSRFVSHKPYTRRTSY